VSNFNIINIVSGLILKIAFGKNEYNIEYFVNFLTYSFINGNLFIENYRKEGDVMLYINPKSNNNKLYPCYLNLHGVI